MHPVPVLNLLWSLLFSAAATTSDGPDVIRVPVNSRPLNCDCTITQAGATYPISALMGTESAVAFYDYGNPNGSSANTGLELSNGLIIFLYEDINTGIISLFLIADIANSGSGGTMQFEVNCLPPAAFVSVQDDPGEFNGAPPLITGNWTWSGCCTDGGVIESIGCNNTLNLDLLVSSGIDSIVWLTGDIASPDQILLAMSGEAITINCGGGVCCPIGLDTDVSVTDATCPDTPNGSITLSPQDGTPAYSYTWSNGASTATNSNLLPGTYMVTVTDASGCTEELVIEVNYSPGDPEAQPTGIILCSLDPQDYFDLTSVDDIVNLGSGFQVLWFENADMTGNINDPQHYLSGSNTIYAVVDNGSCLSDPVHVTLTLLLSPVANTATLYMCEESNGMATFNLTSLDPDVSGGVGYVEWYLDPGLLNPIPDPEAFFSASTTVYAAVVDDPCMSEGVEIELIVDPKPLGDETDAAMCGDDNDEAVFDLTLLEIEINSGVGSIDWYLEIELLDPISSPTAFQTATTTVYAVVFDGICYSDPIAVDLIVEMTPVGNAVNPTICGDETGTGIINLWDYTSQISGGAGGVDWFLDPVLEDPILNPDAFSTESTTIYAVIDNGICLSEPVPINIIVLESPAGNPESLSTCADSSGQGMFNLAALDASISGGTGSVYWYEDAEGMSPISNPGTYMSSGAIVYAQINAAGCLSEVIPVTLTIINSVVAIPTELTVCDYGTASFNFDLTEADEIVSGGSGTVNWFIDAAGTMPVPFPDMFVIGSNTTVFASVSAGICSSEIVPIQLTILPSPQATDLMLEFCTDLSGMITLDLNSLNDQVNATLPVSWFTDQMMSAPVSNVGSFQTGDTTLYAFVNDNGCITSAQVVIDVQQTPAASAIHIEQCKESDENLTIDLTDWNIDVGSGLMVNWFLDPQGLNEIYDPDSIVLNSSQTFYANTSAGICTSELVAIDLVIMDFPQANPLNIERCGDINGQTLINLLATEELISNNTGTVEWFSDNQLMNPLNDPENFLTGDTIIYAQVINGFCYSPVVTVSVAIVDSLTAYLTEISICDGPGAEVIDLTAFDTDISQGNGDVIWFLDPGGIDTITDPSNYMIAQDSIFAIVTADGCISGITAIPVLLNYPPPPPSVSCDTSTLSTVSIAWTDFTGEVGYEYTINQGTGSGTFQSTDSILEITNLNSGDLVTLNLWSIGSVCGNSDTITISCNALSCPDVTIEFSHPGRKCLNDTPFNLGATWSGLPGVPVAVWTGDAVIDPSGIFDPSVAQLGDNEVILTLSSLGCIYTDTFDVVISFVPEAAFTLTGNTCVDSLLYVSFTGEAYLNSDWNWNLDGAVLDGDPPVEFGISWEQPGQYEISLQIDDFGCISNYFSLPVTIDAPLGLPELHCVEENYNSIVVSWDDVSGASMYSAFSNTGTGDLTGTTFRVYNLPDNTPVTITVIASGPSACGPTTSTIECHTPEFIPDKYYIPKIFSPDGNGINDVFFISSNSRIAHINVMRVFDRWGNLIFENQNFLPNDPALGWNGSFKEKVLNPDVYLYWIEMVNQDGEKVIETGDITLIR